MSESHRSPIRAAKVRGYTVWPSRVWRYRVGDYRIVCEIQDAAVMVLVVQIGHRREVYR
jgi:mRNA-degrading endonuclease RelE of RelBE toxin-antitoxin system